MITNRAGVLSVSRAGATAQRFLKNGTLVTPEPIRRAGGAEDRQGRDPGCCAQVEQAGVSTDGQSTPPEGLKCALEARLGDQLGITADGRLEGAKLRQIPGASQYDDGSLPVSG